MNARLSLALFATAIIASSSVGNAAPIQLEGTVVMLPRTERCDGTIHRAVTLYRVDRLLRGSYDDKTVLVIHRCPEIPRGPSRYGRGEAGAIKVKRKHLLTLEPLEKSAEGNNLSDPFVDDGRPRYRAVRTDPASALPLIVVSASGGVGTRIKLSFDARAVTIGRGSDCDVMLRDPDVAKHHLRLEVAGDKLRLRDLGSATGTRINGKRLARPRTITYRDRIEIGPYTLTASLLNAEPSTSK